MWTKTRALSRVRKTITAVAAIGALACAPRPLNAQPLADSLRFPPPAIFEPGDVDVKRNFQLLDADDRFIGYYQFGGRLTGRGDQARLNLTYAHFGRNFVYWPKARWDVDPVRIGWFGLRSDSMAQGFRVIFDTARAFVAMLSDDPEARVRWVRVDGGPMGQVVLNDGSVDSGQRSWTARYDISNMDRLPDGTPFWRVWVRVYRSFDPAREMKPGDSLDFPFGWLITRMEGDSAGAKLSWSGRPYEKARPKIPYTGAGGSGNAPPRSRRIRVFPNPAKDGAWVQTDDLKKSGESIELVDGLGRVVGTAGVGDGPVEWISARGLPPGVYRVRLRGLNGRPGAAEPLIVQN